MAKKGDGRENTPKQFRFEQPNGNDGITQTVRVFTGDKLRETVPPAEKDDEIDFDFPETPPTRPINPNSDKITDTLFDLHSLPPTARQSEPASAKPERELPEIRLGPPEGEQTIEKAVQDVARKRTKIYPEALIKLLHRLKKEEGKK